VLNHVYTLLMNRDGDDPPATLYPGEDAVEPTYRAPELPAGLLQVRAHLFGATPDRHMLAYRCRQYLGLVAGGELAGHLTAFDPRLAHTLDDELFDQAAFRPAVTRLAGPAGAALTVLGRPDAPDASGLMYHLFRVEGVDSNTLRVARLVTPISNALFDFAVEDGLSGLVPLDPSGYSFRVNSADPDQRYLVEVVNRPTRELSAVVAALASAGEPALVALFGVGRAEPLQTFRNLWFSRREPPVRLAAAVLALAWQTEARRA
jgi:hypothetical protein